MEEIEVNIKLAENNKIYNILIRKVDTILKLKEYCKILSNIPQDQQNLLYNGKILSNEKLIKDYIIENNHYIILAKKEDSKPVNTPLEQNSDSSNSENNFFNNKNENIPNLSSFYNKIDMNKVDNLFQVLGLGNFSDFGVDPQIYKEGLKGISTGEMMDTMKKMRDDPLFLEKYYNNPKLQKIFQKFPFVKNGLQNLEEILVPQRILMLQNMFKENDKKINESSKTEIPLPPEPFESLNNIQNSQMMNSSKLISNINTFNKNSTGNKEIFSNSGIEIDYKEKYKDQLSQLKDMGFINEENNIKALKHSNGNIYNALQNLLKQN